MSVTYTPAADRVLRQVRAGRWHLGMPDAMLIAASILSIAAIALACAGRLRALDASERAAGAGVCRQSEYRRRCRDARAGAVPGLRGPAGAPVCRARALSISARTSRKRPAAAECRRARRCARGNGTAAPAAGRLLTSSQLAVLKPSFTVRTREAFRNNVLLFGLLYVLGFHIVSFVWRLRSARSDALILVTAHLLTAIGFAAMLARPDPLRDTFLAGRYVEGILLGLALMTAVSLVNFRTIAFLELSYVPLLAALSLSVVLLLVGSGPAGSSAKVNLGPVQPIEGIRLLLALFLAGYFGPPMGAAQRCPRTAQSGIGGCPTGSTCRGASTSSRSPPASAWRSSSSSSRRISARRSSPAACFSPSTRWRGDEPEWRSPASPSSCWRSTPGTSCRCRRR